MKHEERETGRAIILAAGLSSRLYPLTEVRPKPLLPLLGDETIIDRQLAHLTALGIDDVTVVTGHGADALGAHLRGRTGLRHFPDFAKYGNLHTLHSVCDLLNGPLLIVFGDVVAGLPLWTDVANATGDFNLLVDERNSLPGTMRVLRSGPRVLDLGPHIPVTEGNGSFVGLASFSAAAVEQLARRVETMVQDSAWDQGIYTHALASLAQEGAHLTSIPTADRWWIEVDDQGDYDELLKRESRSAK